MHLTTEAGLASFPARCFVTKRDDEGQYLDLEVEELGIHLYLKREIVEQAARVCDMVDRGVHNEILRELDAAETEVSELTLERDELAQKIAAVHLLKRTEGFNPQKKRGPQKREAVAA